MHLLGKTDMEAVVIEKPGGYSSLVLRSKDDPELKSGQYLVSVKYIGVNYADVIIREGYYTAARGKYPLTPGFEFSGVVEKAGPGTSAFEIGDEVCGITLFGGYSTKVAAEELYLRKVPDGWSLKTSAVLLVPHLTAYHALQNVAHAKPKERILVHSAAGGVGTALLQQAKDLGCKTIGVVGSKAKIDTAKHYGADHVVLKSDDLWNEVDKISPDGLDVILDANGLTTPRPGYDRLSLGGRLIIYGFAELFPRGKRPWLPTLAYNALRVPRFRIRRLTSTNRTIAGLNIAFLFERSDLAKPALDYITDRAKRGILVDPPIKEFQFNEVAAAHKHLESGTSVGRSVLAVKLD
jgi:NADPH:quinone reductase-like Zn-dependent oxidoreductase